MKMTEQQALLVLKHSKITFFSVEKEEFLSVIHYLWKERKCH